MTQHTPEPWTIEGGDSVYGGPDSSIEIYAPFSDVFEEENLIRIVACVNACAGIPTSHLQSLAHGALASSEYDRLLHWDKITELKQQRYDYKARCDELLAALIGVRDELGPEWSRKAFDKADEAIAKASRKFIDTQSKEVKQ